MTIQSTHLIVSEQNQLSAIYTKKKLKELDISHSQYTTGNIYIGQLESLVPNINAAFISLDKNEKNGFIQLNNLNKN
jgi:Ribonuclease G/E